MNKAIVSLISIFFEALLTKKCFRGSIVNVTSHQSNENIFSAITWKHKVGKPDAMNVSHNCKSFVFAHRCALLSGLRFDVCWIFVRIRRNKRICLSREKGKARSKHFWVFIEGTKKINQSVFNLKKSSREERFQIILNYCRFAGHEPSRGVCWCADGLTNFPVFLPIAEPPRDANV